MHLNVNLQKMRTAMEKRLCLWALRTARPRWTDRGMRAAWSPRYAKSSGRDPVGGLWLQCECTTLSTFATVTNEIIVIGSGSSSECRTARDAGLCTSRILRSSLLHLVAFWLRAGCRKNSSLLHRCHHCIPWTDWCTAATASDSSHLSIHSFIHPHQRIAAPSSSER